MTVTLREVLAAVRARRATLGGELGGYLLLDAVDQIGRAPRSAGPEDIALLEDGAVRVVGGSAASQVEAESAVRALFAGVLAGGASVSKSLLRVSQRPSGAGLDALLREIEAALIPVNRAAGRRGLARLYRETTRALASGSIDFGAPANPKLAELEPPVNVAGVKIAEPTAQVLPPDAVHTSSVVVPEENPTRPEPVVLRASGRPPSAPIARQLSHTPRLGSMIAMAPPEFVESMRELPPVLLEVSHDSATERMPEVAEEEPIEEAALEIEVTVEELEIDGESAVESECEPEVESEQEVEGECAQGLEAGCEQFVPWNSCVPPDAEDDACGHPFEYRASQLRSDSSEALHETLATLEAGWNEISLRSHEEHEPLPAAASVRVILELDPLTLTAPGIGPVAERVALRTPPKQPPPPPPVFELAPSRFLPRKSDVEALLSGFVVGGSRSDRDLCRELSELAGVDHTSPPPAADSDAPSPVSARLPALPELAPRAR